MIELTFWVGQSLNKAGQPMAENFVLAGRNKAILHIVEEFGGFTSYFGVGGWRNSTGVVMVENLWVIKVVAEKLVKNQAENVAKFLRTTFDQDEVMYTLTEAGQKFSI